MNHFKLPMMLLVAGSLFLGACGGQDKHNTDEVTTEQAAVINTTHLYICPMNCENSGSNEPGKCPVCGMDLVKNPNYQGTETVVDTPTSVNTDTTVDDHAGHNH